MKFSSCAVVFIGLLLSLQIPVHSETVGLEQVIKEVCTKSDSVKMMKETLIKSKQTIKEKWSAAYPNVSSSVFAGRNHAIGLGSSGGSSEPSQTGNVTWDQLTGLLSSISTPSYGTSSAYSASIDVSQPIYTFGKINTAVKVASYYDSSVQCTYRQNIKDLQLAALDAFYKAVLAQMDLDVTERSLARQKELSEFLERNFKLGSGSKAQILATNADLQSLYPQIITARQNARTARMTLSVLMGRGVSDTIQLDTGSTIQSLIAFKLPEKDDAVKNAMQGRTDLQSLAYMSRANEGGMKIYKSMNLPTIAAQGSFGFSGADIGDAVKWDNRNWKIGIGLQWNIFDGFENSSLAKQYQSDSRKLRLASDMSSKMVEIAVDAALSECVAADSNLTASMGMYSAAQESYELTNENFKQGSGQFSELQLAEERLRQSEMNIMNARYRQMRSRAALLVTMGKDIIKLEDK